MNSMSPARIHLINRLPDMRTLIRVLVVLMLAGALGPVSAGYAQDENTSLDLTVRNYGISIGNAPVVNGLRMNFRDDGLRRVNGINLTLWLPHDPATGTVNGLALGLPATGGGTLNGVTVGVLGLQANGSMRGVAVGGLGLGAGRDVRGVAVGGLGVGAGDIFWGIGMGGVGVGAGTDVRGIALGGLGVGAGEQLDGIAVGGLGVGAGDRMAGLAAGGLGVGAGGSLSGIAFGGLGVGAGEDIRGLVAGGLGVGAGEDLVGVGLAPIGIGAGEDVTGLTVTGLGVGAGERLRGVHVAGVGVVAPTVSGLMVASAVGGEQIAGGMIAPAYFRIERGGRFSGASVSAFNHIRGTQRGLTIGVFNYTRLLRGVQIGVLNYAGNNPWPFRILPGLNVHL